MLHQPVNGIQAMICPSPARGRAEPTSNQYGMNSKKCFSDRTARLLNRGEMPRLSLGLHPGLRLGLSLGLSPVAVITAIILAVSIMVAWSGVSAAADVVIMDAETVENLPDQNLWKAGGGVHAMIGSLELYTDALEVHMDANEVVAGGPVKILLKGSAAAEQGSEGGQGAKGGQDEDTAASQERLLTGQDLRYNLKTGQGALRKLSATENNFILKSDAVELGDGVYRMSEGFLTTCPLPQPEYVIKARRIDVYPDKYLEARGVLVEILGVPVLPLPVLRLSLTREAMERYQRGEFPIPAAGVNEDKGTYFGITYPYSIDEKNELQLKTEYSSKQGGQIGVSHNYQASPGTLVTTDLGYVFKRGLSGGIAAQKSLAGSLWTLDLSHRLTADGYVRALPELKWNGKALNIRGSSTDGSPQGLNLLNITPQASIGRFEEGVEDSRGSISRVFANRANLGFGWQLPAISPVGKLTLNVGGGARISAYSTGEYLGAATTSASLAFKVSPVVQTSLGYSLTKVAGATPFKFDAPDPGEKLTGGATVKLNPKWQGKVEAEYDLPQMKLAEVTYTLEPLLHCFDVQVYYKQLSRQVGFGFKFK